MLKLRNLSSSRFRKKALLRPDIDVAVLSIQGANGKASLLADLLSRVLDPSMTLFRSGTESVLLAASIEQAADRFQVRERESGAQGWISFLG